MVALLLILLHLVVSAPAGTSAHASAPRVAHVRATRSATKRATKPSTASTTRPAATPTPPATPTQGADISWPNCPKGEGIPSRRSNGEPLPGSDAQFVVLGLTNGPGFYPNPCITDQLTWIRSFGRRLGVYALTTYPSKPEIRQFDRAGPYDGTTVDGALENTAYLEATYNVREMQHLGIHVPFVWVDVEPYPSSPWSASHAANRLVVNAVLRSYRDAGYRVGIYTYAYGWAQVVGDWQLPTLPTWNTVGGAGERAAAKACTRGPSGGPTWLSQWYTPHKDYDLTCPAAPAGSHLFE